MKKRQIHIRTKLFGYIMSIFSNSMHFDMIWLVAIYFIVITVFGSFFSTDKKVCFFFGFSLIRNLHVAMIRLLESKFRRF